MTTTEGIEAVATTADMQDGRGAQRRPRLPDVLGLAWVIVAAGVVMAPALFHSLTLGPFDQLARLGLSGHVHAVAPHNSQTSDLIREVIPWTELAWTQVHHGLLPLWNPYSALGAPLAFNWQSATFSLPALLGYLVPVRFDFTVQVLVTLLVAGSGSYVLCRVMRIGPLGAAMGATVFELSGSFSAVLGWPIASVLSWSGWLFACAILVVRGRHRRRDVTLFALVLALTVYAGEPDTLAILVVSLAVFVAVVLGIRARRIRTVQAVGRPALDMALGSVAGIGLAAPLLLPAAQLTVGAVRGSGRHPGFPPYETLHLIFQTFNGLSLAGSGFVAGVASGDRFDAHGLGYISTAAYIGIIAAVLAVMGVARRHRQPAVVAFGAVAIVAGCLVYAPPLVSVLNDLPGLGEIRWVRAIQLLVFALAILAGAGLDVVFRSNNSRAVRRWLGGGFGTAAVLLLVVWLFGRGHLPPVEAHIRARSFIWPAAEVAIGLAVFGFLVVMSRRSPGPAARRHPLLGNPGRTAALALLISSTGFLVALGAPWWSSSSSYLTTTRAEATLQRAVGSSIVGFGNSSCLFPPTLGIQPDVNVAYGVHEFDSYDPLTPQSLYTAWKESTGHAPTPIGPSYAVPVSLFCAAVKTTASARLFGVGFVLEPHGAKGPPGSVFDERVGNEELYRIPGASVATLSALGADGSLPPVDAPGTPVVVTHPDAASWKLVAKASRPQALRLRLTDVPGWHASIDGKPLKLTRFNRVMLQAKIPPGRHTIELHYWPDTFNVGIVLAVATVIALVFGNLALRRRSRTARSTPAPTPE
ncbi:MAG: YfhO family protein [Acidimicrobiales bacterium]